MSSSRPCGSAACVLSGVRCARRQLREVDALELGLCDLRGWRRCRRARTLDQQDPGRANGVSSPGARRTMPVMKRDRREGTGWMERCTARSAAGRYAGFRRAGSMTKSVSSASGAPESITGHASTRHRSRHHPTEPEPCSWGGCSSLIARVGPGQADPAAVLRRHLRIAPVHDRVAVAGGVHRCVPAHQAAPETGQLMHAAVRAAARAAVHAGPTAEQPPRRSFSITEEGCGRTSPVRVGTKVPSSPSPKCPWARRRPGDTAGRLPAATPATCARHR